jgi:hypothetical protein
MWGQTGIAAMRRCRNGADHATAFHWIAMMTPAAMIARTTAAITA